MSSFNCETCHAMCTDTECGYVTGCEHYPVNPKHLNKWYRTRLSEVFRELSFMKDVSMQNRDGYAEPFSKSLFAVLDVFNKTTPTLGDSQTATVHAQQPGL